MVVYPFEFLNSLNPERLLVYLSIIVLHLRKLQGSGACGSVRGLNLRSTKDGLFSFACASPWLVRFDQKL